MLQLFTARQIETKVNARTHPGGRSRNSQEKKTNIHRGAFPVYFSTVCRILTTLRNNFEVHFSLLTTQFMPVFASRWKFRFAPRRTPHSCAPQLLTGSFPREGVGWCRVNFIYSSTDQTHTLTQLSRRRCGSYFLLHRNWCEIIERLFFRTPLVPSAWARIGGLWVSFFGFACQSRPADNLPSKRASAAPTQRERERESWKYTQEIPSSVKNRIEWTEWMDGWMDGSAAGIPNYWDERERNWWKLPEPTSKSWSDLW